MPGYGLHRGFRAENPHAEGGAAFPDGRLRGVAGGLSGRLEGRGLKDGSLFFETVRTSFILRELSPGETWRIMGR